MRKKDVIAITSVRRALTEDVHDRTVRYLVSMGIRTACVVLIIILPSPWLWLAAAGGFLLPPFAVLVANAGRERPPEDPAYVDAANARTGLAQLPAPTTAHAPSEGTPASRAEHAPAADLGLPASIFDPTSEYLR